MIIDIIFETGEHIIFGSDSSFLIKLLISFLGAFFGFGFALYLYYKKNKKEEKKENEKKEYENKSKLKYFNTTIQSFIAKSNSQNKNIREFIEKQRISANKIEFLKVIPSNDFQRFLSIESKGIFEVYVSLNGEQNKDWIEKYKSILFSLDYLEGIRSEIFRVSLKHMDSSYKSQLNLKSIIESISNKIAFYLKILSENYQSEKWKNPIFVELNNILINYEKIIKENTDFDKLNIEFLEPTITILYDEKYDPKMEEIILLCKKARVCLNDLKEDIEFQISEFEKVHKEINDTLIKLCSWMNELNKSISYLDPIKI